MTPNEVLADYKRAVRHLRRLGQVSALAWMRFYRHLETCDDCSDPDEEFYCSEGGIMLCRAESYRAAYLTMTGKMIWK